MKKRETGQSTIEFLLSFVFSIGFLFLFLKTALNFTNGFLFHYATYMASRTYLVVDNNSNQVGGADDLAAKRAREVFSKNFQLGTYIPGYSKGMLKINSPAWIKNKPYVGVWAQYQDKFSLAKTFGGSSDVTFRSESFLGREPTREECVERICAAMKDLGGTCISHTTFTDNGC